MNTPHRGQVHHEALIAHGGARHTVATPDGCRQMSLTGGIDGGDYVRHARTPHDQGGTFVHHPVEGPARRLVSWFAASDQFTAQPRFELLDIGFLENMAFSLEVLAPNSRHQRRAIYVKDGRTADLRVRCMPLSGCGVRFPAL